MGKKVYAAGQWSRAAASSLVAKETAASQPQVNRLLSEPFLSRKTYKAVLLCG